MSIESYAIIKSLWFVTAQQCIDQCHTDQDITKFINNNNNMNVHTRWIYWQISNYDRILSLKQNKSLSLTSQIKKKLSKLKLFS